MSSLIVMDSAIKFYNESCLMTIEVRHKEALMSCEIVQDRVLPIELVTRKVLSTKCIPENSLGLSRSLSQFSAGCDSNAPKFCFPIQPHGFFHIPLPFQGRGTEGERSVAYFPTSGFTMCTSRSTVRPIRAWSP